MTVKINGEDYILCAKCGIHRNPESFKVKKQTRKSCNNCRGKK